MSHSQLASRLFRIEPRCAGKLDDTRYLVGASGAVWLLDTQTGALKEATKFRPGWSAPLCFCHDGHCAYWGDYGANALSEEVNVYRMSPHGEVKTVYSFPLGTVRHIHGIVWDREQRLFYVFTGDLEPTAGIYTATEDWSEVRPLLTGSQQYRAVVGFPTTHGLLYATDSVESANHIYLARGGKAEVLSDFPGSCIYGCETLTHYLFSSTVEPPEGRGLLDLFSYRLGAGIRDRRAHLVAVRKRDLHIEELLSVKKDWLPMKLFQYGALTFPGGQERCRHAVYNIVACKGDGRTKVISL